ncbi:MAG TPA: amino acid adenylation domain-containing protein, partial [Longimicrobium sp.]|nr:amino acid adenylation domain-containing protein [Longimicrobium sp.]
HLDRVLRQLADDPDRRLSELDLLDDEERRLILHAWNAPAREVEAACIHPLFAAQAARTPDAEAVRFAGRGMTYRELDEASSRLAHHLAARGVRPESRVGVLAERAPETVVGILAVLKAGGAYVPLDPAYPAERLRYMLADCGAHTVLAPAGVPEELAGLIPDVLDLRAEQDAIRRHPAAAPPVPAHPDGVAYVIYTSGSTGLPKGVMVAHRGVPNLARMHRDRYGVGPGTRVLQFASFSFDAAVWEMFPTLLSGATLVLASRDDLLPGPGLVETLRSERVSLVTLPPPVLAVLPADELPELRTVVSAGEALDAAIVDRWSAGRTLVNAYGPTETTVCATFGICQADGRTPPIGRAFDNVHVHVLEGAGRLSPVGVPGELCVGGVGVARGYLNRPALTAERFVPDPFGAPGSRMYRTGDRARWRPSGTLEFMGRADGQVKVNGFRVEPGEVEAVLRRYPGVRECAVVARQEARGGRRLVGYVVPEPDAGAPFPAEGSALAAALRAHLLQHLPAHMVPGAFVRLDALPMTPNGKLDRAALPAPEPGRAHLQEDEPRNFVEVQLIQLWEEVLGVRNVGATQSFFEVGGSSLLALPLLAKMNRIPGCDVSVSTLFAGATVRQLADAVLDGRSDAPRPASPVVPLQPNGSLPPLFVIHPAGRSVSGYVHLVRHLGADQPVYGVEDRGEDLARPIEQIAAEHLRAIRSVQPRGPYALAGWSFGGYVAYEMAVQLERGGEQAAFVGLLDAISPRWAQAWAGSSLASSPFRMARGVAWQMRVDFPVEEAEVEGLHPDEQIRFLVGVLHAQGVDPAGFGEETLRVMCGMMEDRRTSVDRYAPGRFHGTLTVFRASIAPSQEQWEAVASTDEERRTQGWSVLAGGPVEVHRVPGSHNSMGAEPHVRVLAQLVREEMAAGHARTAAAAA